MVVAVAVFLTAMVTFLDGLASAGPNPPGNNGTIKIDDILRRSPQQRAPCRLGLPGRLLRLRRRRPGCHTSPSRPTRRPSGGRGPGAVDRHGVHRRGRQQRRGSEAGLDATETYTLDFTGITPHPVQGFHVKLTINAEGSQGADVKHKVFWVTTAPPPPPQRRRVLRATRGRRSTSGATATSAATTHLRNHDDVGPTTTSQGDHEQHRRLGALLVGPGGCGGGALPFTGTGTTPLLLVGLVLAGLVGPACSPHPSEPDIDGGTFHPSAAFWGRKGVTA